MGAGLSLGVPMFTVVGGASGVYIFSSLYLLRYPLKRHLITPKMPSVKLIGHRGGAGEGYENTGHAYNNAVNLGVGMLELDVHLTKDGEVVVAHDQNLSRLTGLKANIRDLKYSELPKINSRLNIDFQPGEYFCDETVIEEKRCFIKFNSVLNQYPDTQINIDVKVQDQGLVEKVNKIIQDNNAEKRCVWGSFREDTTELCYKTNPKIGLIFSMKQVVRLYLMFYLGLIVWMDIKETHLELPMPSIFLDPKYRTKEGNVGIARIGPWIIKILDWILMSPVLFSYLEKRGIYTYLWVLNTEEEYERAFNLGVHGVMTDYPTKLKQYLEKNKQC